jgi:hypothetical protein
MSVPDAFEKGVQALKEQRPAERVEAIAEVDNMIIVRLGTYELSEYEPPYPDDSVDIYARIGRNFPDWTGNRKGFITSPPLDRESGALNNNPWDVPAKDAVKQVTGEPAQSYSWDWRNVPMDEPEHMAYAHDLAQNMLQHG